MKLSVVLIACNEEANLARTLESVRALVRDGQGEIVVVDSGSTGRTVEIAKSFGASLRGSVERLRRKRIPRSRKLPAIGS